MAIVVLLLLGTHTLAWRTATSRAEDRMALQWQAGQIAAWHAAHTDAAAKIAHQATLATRAQRQRDQLSAHLQEIDHAPLPAAPDCPAWTPDQRLRLEQRRAAHADIDNPTPGLLLNPLPTDASHPGEPL